MTILSTKISTQNPKTLIFTTLNRIREHSPCHDGWKRLIRHLGRDFPRDTPFPMVEILNAKGDGLGDCLWALRVEPQHAKLYRLYAVNRARSVQHLMNDPRSVAAIDVAERYAHGTATEDELDAARGAAWDAAWAAAGAAAGGAAWAAAWAAARGAAGAAARGASGAAVCDAARGAARAAAAIELREMLTDHHAMPGEPAL